MKNITTEELYWIAGLLEGEGSFYVAKPNLTQHCSAALISIVMTDLDIIERAASILGGGSKIYVYNSKKRNKTSYKFAVTGSDLAIEWMNALYPLMGNRRQQKIKEITDYWANRLDKSQRMQKYNAENYVIRILAKAKNITIEEAKVIFESANNVNRVN